MSAAVTMKLMYGYDISSRHDRFVVLSEEAVIAGSKYSLPNATIVNIFPALRHLPSWFPGAGFKKVGERIKKVTTDMKDAPIEYVKQKMVCLSNWTISSIFMFIISG